MRRLQARFWSLVQIPNIANFFFGGRRTENHLTEAAVSVAAAGSVAAAALVLARQRIGGGDTATAVRW